MQDTDLLKRRGWRPVELHSPSEQTIPRSETWRLGWEPFCAELELWDNGEIRGRICAPGLKVHGTMTFDSLRSIEDAVDFLEKLVEGATNALPDSMKPEHQRRD